MNQIAVSRHAATHDRPMDFDRKLRNSASLPASLSAWLSLVALAIASHAGAETTVELLDTEPASRTVTLGKNQTFYMRLGYTTDEPVRIWARPYFEGREVNAGSNPSRLHEGEGEALAWFFFLGQPGDQVDEIRISAGDGSAAGTHELLRFPVRITAGAQPAAASAQPDWLARLRAEEQRLQREDYERRMSEPVSVGDQLFGAGFMLVVLAVGIGGIALPVRAVRRWSGGWRVAAALPALWVGVVVLRIVVHGAIDPTSHNLWPFEVAQASVVSLVLFGAIALTRRIFGGRTSER